MQHCFTPIILCTLRLLKFSTSPIESKPVHKSCCCCFFPLKNSILENAYKHLFPSFWSITEFHFLEGNWARGNMIQKAIYVLRQTTHTLSLYVLKTTFLNRWYNLSIAKSIRHMNNLWSNRKCLLRQLFDWWEEQWPRAWALRYAAWVQTLAAQFTRCVTWSSYLHL